jgi:hypothetical protein
MLSRVLLFILAFSACDPVAEDTDGTTGDPPPPACPALCDGTCPPECIVSACITVGDWCDLKIGDQQCGERMACKPIQGSGSSSGVCVAPCSATEPCGIGKCDPDVGACYAGDDVLATPIAC